MKQGGRHRRSEEHPDSAFGEALKEHLRRVRHLTQAELARESIIAEKTLSNMVKGKRQSGPVFRRDLRAIIRVLYQKGALHSLEEANELLTKIPVVKELDERDPDDAEIIALLKPAANTTQPARQDRVNGPQMRSLKASADQKSEPPHDQVPSQPSTASSQIKGQQNQFIWFVSLLLVALFFGILLFKNIPNPWQPAPPNPCPDTKDGVILYTDPHFQGHCHLFPPGDYDLSQFGLDQNVSSLKDPDATYYVRLIDRTNRPGSFDKDVPQLPADWNDQAHSLHVEKHRQTSQRNDRNACIDTDYSTSSLIRFPRVSVMPGSCRDSRSTPPAL